MTELFNLSPAAFTRLVNEAFKSYASLLELSRSPLARSGLVSPALVVDDVAPTADDRGRALRVLLRWAVGRLAPTPPTFPLGQPRPFDDPTWTDPLWWGYNILRHRYLEPLRPDDLDDLGCSGFTEGLAALTGIAGPDRLFDERDRAVHEVANVLREQLNSRQGDEELRRMAVEELCQSLERHSDAREVFGLAATFREVFPRALLLEMAAAERLPDAAAALDDLVSRRFLVEGDEGANLLLPPALQEFVHARQARGTVVRRHRHAAEFYQRQDRPLPAAWHLQHAGQAEAAAGILLTAAAALVEDWQVEELREALIEFGERDLSPALWIQVQVLLSDLLRKAGNREEALEVCRRALKKAGEPLQQARLYHRLGKLYEDHNQMHALGYYQRAAESFPPDADELIELLTDRGWLHIHRREWERAEADLTAALEKAGPRGDRATAPGKTSPEAWRQQAAIYDALASLHRQQGHFQPAIDYALKALFIREEKGDQLQVADSYNNLATTYTAMGEFDHALESLEEALEIFRRLDNREAIATALLNAGGTLYFAGRLPAAVERYQESLWLFQEINLPRGEAQARYNLAEALAQLGQAAEARRHWQEGYALSGQAGLDDQVEWFLDLRRQTPALQEIDITAEPSEKRATPGPDRPDLLPDEQAILELVQRRGRVTARLLMDQLHVSKATATRRLAELAERGVLVRVGEGRATCYVQKAIER